MLTKHIHSFGRGQGGGGRPWERGIVSPGGIPTCTTCIAPEVFLCTLEPLPPTSSCYRVPLSLFISFSEVREPIPVTLKFVRVHRRQCFHTYSWGSKSGPYQKSNACYLIAFIAFLPLLQLKYFPYFFSPSCSWWAIALRSGLPCRCKVGSIDLALFSLFTSLSFRLLFKTI